MYRFETFFFFFFFPLQDRVLVFFSFLIIKYRNKFRSSVIVHTNSRNICIKFINNDILIDTFLLFLKL